MELMPQKLIIGSGDPGLLKVSQQTRDWLDEQGISLTVMPTREACNMYNDLSDKDKVVMGLHLTC